MMPSPPNHPTTTPLPPRFGRFEVQGRLGRGGMGVVYRARDPVIGRAVAIKVLQLDPRLEHEARENMQERFEREFRSAGALAHPNIVTVYDVGHQDDVAYIAMELVDGKSLDQVLRSGPRLGDAQIAAIVKDLASALDYAHREGVVHRDIKPANILFSAEGRPKVADFGVARARSSSLTTEGTLIGTPGFIAPEQILGGAVTCAADQFALGVLAYRMFTGAAPFEAEDSAATLYKVAHEPPPPLRRYRRDLSPEVEAALERAMAKDPAQRFSTCTGLARQLASALGLSSGEALHAEVMSARPAAPLPPVRDHAPDAILSRPVVPRHRETDERSSTETSDALSTDSYGGVTSWWRRRGAGRRLLAALALLLIAAIATAGGIWWWRDQQSAALASSVPGAAEGETSAAPDATRPPEQVDGTASPRGADIATVSGAPPAPAIEPVVEQYVERYTITSEPSGAAVHIDDDPTAAGTTPIDLELTVGEEHRIVVGLEGFHTASQNLIAEIGEGQELPFRLQPIIPPGYIRVAASFPVSATLEGRRLRPEAELEPGRYNVRLSAPDLFFEETRTVIVEPGETTTIDLPRTHETRVAAVPGNARVIIDAALDRAFEPPFDLTVIAGSSHQLRFEWPDGRALEQTVRFEPGVRQILGSPGEIRVRAE